MTRACTTYATTLWLTLLVGLCGVCPMQAADNRQLYERIDSLISRQADITRQKEERIRVIRDGLDDPTLTDDQRFKIQERLYDEYLAFRYDSAYKYAMTNVETQQALGNRQRLASSRMRLAHILSVTGMFEQATQQLRSIDVGTLSPADLAEYYTQKSEMYLFLSEYAFGTVYFQAYHDSALAYRRRILDTAPHDSHTYIFNHATYIGEQQYTGDAISELEHYLARLEEGDRRYSIVANTLAYLYGQRHQPERREHYLLLSAASDLRGAIRENNALRELSMVLLDKGDLNRAFVYIRTAVADAEFYGTRLRNLQSAQLAPHITALYNEARERQSKRTYWTLIGMTGLTLLLIVGLSAIWQLLKKRRDANRKIHQMNTRLEQANSQLHHANGAMKESNKIKDEYLGRLLELCSTYIDRAEEQRKKENRLARDKRLAELYAELKSTRFISDATQQFYQTFDTAFLNIYPHFVGEVNRLLADEYHIDADSGKLTTELRILALLRLGISDNQKIASILRSSITTIYTYRSKLKAKAKEKDTFEDSIRQIESY